LILKRKYFLVGLFLMLVMFLAGCSGSEGTTPPVSPVIENQSPTASFTADPTSGVAPLEVAFNASNSSDSDGTIVSYAWDFKDGETGNGETISHTFSSIGSYNVMLTVTDNDGATDSITKTINVTETLNQSPIASFTADPTFGVAPLEVAFNASNSSDPDGSITSYAWDFKDGETGNGETISHTFSSIGSYNVMLTVTDNDGATDLITKTINVTETSNQSPTASFTADPTSGVAPLEVSFNASNSYDPDGSIISYAWDFKDGATGSGQTINHTFSSIGSYNAELTVTDNEGATDSTAKTITVTETPNQSSDCYESMIVSPVPFMGNNGEIFKLIDGSLWEVKYEYEYLYEYYPSVVICPSQGKLIIGGKSLNVELVASGEAVIESTIISDFNGLEYGNIYELANGQIWQQTEYYIWYWYWFYPGVLIWNDGGIYRMKVEGIDHPVMVKRIN